MDFNHVVAGNEISRYVFSVASFIGGLTLAWMVRWVLIFRLQNWATKSETPIDDFIVDSFRRTLMPLLIYLAFRLSVQNLILPSLIVRSLNIFGKILIAWLVVRVVSRTLQFGLTVWAHQRKDAALERQLKGLLPILTFLIWSSGLLVLADNLGFKVTTVLAGLGVGGVAVALASQAILGDLFGYLAILLDKPFEVGDFIIVNDFMGSVEHIGIKTTRLRSLGGEQLIFSNTDLTNSRVRNYKRMELRRIVFKLGVVYETSKEKLQKIPDIIKRIIAPMPDVRFDRAHFLSFDDFCLTFEIVYFVLSADYNKYMDIQQTINLGIKVAFENENIEFAYPTQTLYLHKNDTSSSIV